MKTNEQYFTVAEIATILKVHWQTVLNYIKSNKLKAVKLGKGYRIGAQSLKIFTDHNSTAKH